MKYEPVFKVKSVAIAFLIACLVGVFLYQEAVYYYEVEVSEPPIYTTYTTSNFTFLTTGFSENLSPSTNFTIVTPGYWTTSGNETPIILCGPCE